MTLKGLSVTDPHPEEGASSDTVLREAHPPRTRLRKLAFPVGALLTLGGLFAAGYVPKLHAREQLVASMATPAARTVSVIKPKPLPGERVLKLSASLNPYEQTQLHARASGYLRRWAVDLGEHVQAGQLLAEIETPELDRELDQARSRLVESEAAVTLAQASQSFAEATLKRYADLASHKLTSKQELARFESEAQIAGAQVQVAEAARSSLSSNVKRLQQLKSFARVEAPFAGTITARHVERGSLVTAGVTPLFELASVNPLRITANVPQTWALGIENGLLAKLSVAEYPTRTFAARVARSAGKLDAASRTLHVELEVDNPDGALMPGMFGSVELSLRSAHEVVAIPSNALLTGKEGTRVAVVDDDGRVSLRTVLVERDNGAEVELAGGVGAHERIVANASSGLRDGTLVKPAK
jgi:membrane fusion protein (multidrug efflux system)